MAGQFHDSCQHIINDICEVGEKTEDLSVL